MWRVGFCNFLGQQWCAGILHTHVEPRSFKPANSILGITPCVTISHRLQQWWRHALLWFTSWKSLSFLFWNGSGSWHLVANPPFIFMNASLNPRLLCPPTRKAFRCGRELFLTNEINLQSSTLFVWCGLWLYSRCFFVVFLSFQFGSLKVFSYFSNDKAVQGNADKNVAFCWRGLKVTVTIVALIIWWCCRFIESRLTQVYTQNNNAV